LPGLVTHHDAFDALGDANRRAIVEILSAGGRAVGAGDRRRLPISRPAVSRHLRLLKDAGLVIDQTAGTSHIYELARRGRRGDQGVLHRGLGRGGHPLSHRC
jgi:DNA-binding transcriptional ArsR family regulator